MQINSWEKTSHTEKISLTKYNAEKNLTPLYLEKNFLTPERFGKQNSQTKSVKSAILDTPTNVQWLCQPFRGEETDLTL